MAKFARAIKSYKYRGCVANKRFEASKFKFKFPRARTYELIRARSRKVGPQSGLFFLFTDAFKRRLPTAGDPARRKLHSFLAGTCAGVASQVLDSLLLNPRLEWK